jgi:PHD/YefM family antitoxin component YafN of YafNO toxin-antitoxin module
MPRTVILKEAQAPYTLSLEEATLSQETVILEREGRPVAAVVPFDEYEAFATWREQEEWEQEWARLPSGEQEGTWPDELTPEMLEARLRAIRESYGIVKMDDPNKILTIATGSESALENIWLALEGATDADDQP